jgi:signal transduction histidine kinase
VPENVPLGEPAAAVTVPDRQHAWETGTLRWEAFYLFVFVAVLVIVLVGTPGSTVVAVTAVAATVPWYLLMGRPMWTGGRAGRRPGPAWETIYIVGLVAAFGVAQSQNPEVWFLAFAISPQFYMFLETRLAMVLGIAVNFLAAALLVARYPGGATAATAFGVAVAGGGFSVFYGAWVTRIIMQSAERAEIIDQLEATRAELAAAQHEAGRLAERQRLAADIHDTLAQGFTSILMLIQAAQADLAGAHGSHPLASGHLDLAERTARDNLAEARALVANLAPARLEGSTLPDALRRVSGEHREASFGVSGTPRPLPVATEVVLLRVCQEALANVRKHAHARSASVLLGYDPAAVRLEVCDDGAGFDPDRVSGGYGLRGMRTRVAEAGGTLTVHSSPGAGTQVSATVPA